MLPIAVVCQDLRRMFLGAFHVLGYVGMVLLLGRRSVIQGLGVNMRIVGVQLDGIHLSHWIHHVIHSVEMDMLWVQRSVREEGMDVMIIVNA